jgi:hypothetical protein
MNMSESMQMQIDEVVEELSPPLGSIGMLTTQDVRNLVQKAATKGTLIGWVAAERLTSTRYKQDYDNLAQHCKQLELEIMELKR